MRNRLFCIPIIASLILCSGICNAEVVVISHNNVSDLNKTTIKRIYTGRIIELNGVALTPVNAIPSHPVRARFLKKYLEQNEDKYTAYWTVRRFIGKGTPPQELNSETKMIEFVRNTPGAIGYVDNENINIPADLSIHR